MHKVRGIGGVFFKSKDPEALKAWYAKHLGIPLDEHGFVSFPWTEDDGSARKGMTVWNPFENQTEYFKGSPREFMVNFVVDDVRGMLQQLREGGCNVDDEVQDDEYGIFGWVTDPDGTRIELWQPPAKMPGSEP